MSINSRDMILRISRGGTAEKLGKRASWGGRLVPVGAGGTAVVAGIGGASLKLASAIEASASAFSPAAAEKVSKDVAGRPDGPGNSGGGGGGERG